MGVKIFSQIYRKNRLRVLKNRAWRRIFGPKKEEETGGWRVLNNEGLYGLYLSSNIIRVIKSRSLRDVISD
jgi:hypothetical protein